MNYIIDPMVFYWISVLNSLSGICILCLVLSAVGVFVFGVMWIIEHDCWDEDEERTFRIALRVTIPILILGILGVIFIPDKTAMIEMLVAKTATVENAEWTADTLKSLVDYIVQAAKAIK